MQMGLAGTAMTRSRWPITTRDKARTNKARITTIRGAVERPLAERRGIGGQEASGGWVGRRDFLYALRISDGEAKEMARAGTATQIVPLRDNRKHLAWNFAEFVVGRSVA
jgi:hypothetical protein